MREEAAEKGKNRGKGSMEKVANVSEMQIFMPTLSDR